MNKVDIPILDTTIDTRDDQLKELVASEGIVRLSELEDQLSYSDEDLRLALFRLLERGDVALFPIGDTIQVRDATDD